MADPVKQVDSPRKIHPIAWESEEWQRILEAAGALSEREHLDLGPTDIIRSGTRRFVDELLNPQPAKAS